MYEIFWWAFYQNNENKKHFQTLSRPHLANTVTDETRQKREKDGERETAIARQE